MSLSEDLLNLKSYTAMNDVLNDIKLHDLQCVDILKLLYNKEGIVIYETGLGKTYIASAIMKMLINEDPSKKFIFLCTKNQLLQTPQKISNATGLRVVYSDGQENNLKKLIQNNQLKKCQVLMITEAVLLNDKFMSELFKIKTLYSGIIIDEAHKMNNFSGSQMASILESLLYSMEYKYALTATPITTDLLQLAKLAHIIDPALFPSTRKLFNSLKYGRYRLSDNKLFFIVRNGEEFGRTIPPKGMIFWVDPTPEQEMSRSSDPFVYKGDNAYNQLEALCSALDYYTSEGLRGLVYINRHNIRNAVITYLKDNGYDFNYDCIHGFTKASDRESILHEFNDKKSLDFIITSVTEALDLDCDYVLFYETTSDIKQMIGRAQRGFHNKNLDVVFFITKGTPEVLKFYNIYKNSVLIEDIVGSNYEAITSLQDELIRMGIEHEN